jgi:hypothetical protein
MRTTWLVAVISLTLGVVTLALHADEVAVPLDKVPKAVLDAVKTRFPQGALTEASKETEGDKVSYEVSVKLAGKNIDVTLTPAGAIMLIEKEIASADVPAAVKTTITREYPNQKFDLVEEVIKVADGKETLQYYEYHGKSADGKEVEVEVLPDGKVKK